MSQASAQRKTLPEAGQAPTQGFLPDYLFRASRCFRKELSRVILAFSTLIASVFVGFCFGCVTLFTFPTDDIIGITEARIGCSLIGPVVGLFLGMGS